MHASPFVLGFSWHERLVTVGGYTVHLLNMCNSFSVLCCVRLCLHGPWEANGSLIPVDINRDFINARFWFLFSRIK